MKINRVLPITAILLIAALLRAWISDFTLILLDYDAFYHARIAEQIHEGHHIPTWDARELGGIPHYYPPLYHILIVLGKYILPGRSTIAVGSILTVYFGIISTLFVYLLGRRFSVNAGLAAALLYALTPMMVVRSGLWARPTGISMMLAILAIYLFLKMKEGNKYASLALLVSLGYIFAHSSVLLILSLVLATLVITRDMHKTRTFLKIALVLLAAGGLYYYRMLPFLNFSISRSGEYMPLTQPLLELYPFSNLVILAEAFLYLGLFNLTIFPIILHGIYEMFKREKPLGLLALFSLFLIFFKANMFILLNFTVCIAIAVSIFRISRISGPPIAFLLLLAVVGMDAALLQMINGEKKAPHIDLVEGILSDAPLTSENLVLSNDPNVGHAIPYYSPASTFISDLTDTKQFDKNREIFARIKDDGTRTEEALSLLHENHIDYLLIINEPFPFMKDSTNFEIIKKVEKNETRASLYVLKK
jgi:hypothetical protein